MKRGTNGIQCNCGDEEAVPETAGILKGAMRGIVERHQAQVVAAPEEKEATAARAVFWFDHPLGNDWHWNLDAIISQAIFSLTEMPMTYSGTLPAVQGLRLENRCQELETHLISSLSVGSRSGEVQLEPTHQGC